MAILKRNLEGLFEKLRGTGQDVLLLPRILGNQILPEMPILRFSRTKYVFFDM